jgi:predicted DNA-binding transcriptional regulator AlpA
MIRFGAVPARPKPEPDPTADGLPRWLSIKEVAEDLGISIHTAYKWSQRGYPWFPRSIRLRNGDKRVRRDWYQAWLTDMEQR